MATKNSDNRIGFHFVVTRGNKKFSRDNKEVKTGEVRTEDSAVLCQKGLHASPTLYDACGYAPSNGDGQSLTLVEVSDIKGEDESKFVGLRRKVLKMMSKKKTHNLMINIAKKNQALAEGYSKRAAEYEALAKQCEAAALDKSLPLPVIPDFDSEDKVNETIKGTFAVDSWR
jgi:hypothetical protein